MTKREGKRCEYIFEFGTTKICYETFCNVVHRGNNKENIEIYEVDLQT